MTYEQLTRGVTPEPGYPKWVHRPAGQIAWKREDCRVCGKQIRSQDEGTHTLWVTCCLTTFQCCDGCAPSVIEGSTT